MWLTTGIELYANTRGAKFLEFRNSEVNGLEIAKFWITCSVEKKYYLTFVPVGLLFSNAQAFIDNFPKDFKRFLVMNCGTVNLITEGIPPASWNPLFIELINKLDLDDKTLEKMEEYTNWILPRKLPRFNELKGMTPDQALVWAKKDYTGKLQFELAKYYINEKNDLENSMSFFQEIPESSDLYFPGQSEIHELLMKISLSYPKDREYMEYLFITASNIARHSKGEEHTRWQKEADMRFAELAAFDGLTTPAQNVQPDHSTLLTLAKLLNEANTKIAQLESIQKPKENGIGFFC